MSVTEVSTYVVPLQKSSILVPNATVAEVIPYEPLQRVQDTPDWFLGYLGWRGVQVPVISFEMLTVQRGSFSLVSVSSACLLVLKSVSGASNFDFLAMVAQAEPKLVPVTADELFAVDEAPNQTELERFGYGDEVVSIPDFDFIESQLAGVLEAT